MKRNDEFRISDILYGIIKHRILIVSLTIVGLLVGIVLSGISFLQGEMSKQYMITSSFTVNTQTEEGSFTSGFNYPDYNDVNMSEDLVGTVSYVLKSDMMLEDIINSLGLLGVTTSDIYSNLKLQQYEETQIIEMNLYWRSADEGINILTELTKKAPEILKETLNIGTISVLNQPAAKYIIGGNVNVVLWGYTTLIGLGIGLIITILIVFVHPTLINTEDIGKVYEKELLGEIAEDEAYFAKRKSVMEVDGISLDVRESFASAAHIIHSRLQKKEKPHVVYVTSTLRGEGKTSVIANLAIQLSNLEKHVLLVDLDTRNPNLGGMFLKKVDYAHSLNAFYAGDISKTEAVVSLNGYLDIMPTVLERNSIPLDSNLFRVIKQIADDYDYILIDTAPVGLIADSMNLDQIASAVLFVIRYDDATLKEINVALERIDKMGAELLGCIVNGVKASKKGIKILTKGRENVKRAEEKMDTIGEPLVNLDPTRFIKEEDTNLENVGEPLVTGFSEDKDMDKKEKQTEIVTSSGDFIDRLFQAEGVQTEKAKEAEDNNIEKENAD